MMTVIMMIMMTLTTTMIARCSDLLPARCQPFSCVIGGLPHGSHWLRCEDGVPPCASALIILDLSSPAQHCTKVPME
eukprot:8261314-Karenia_brevis.AAC.1